MDSLVKAHRLEDCIANAENLSEADTMDQKLVAIYDKTGG
jgi:hypothetical protein